jgi:hypothetical protein
MKSHSSPFLWPIMFMNYATQARYLNTCTKKCSSQQNMHSCRLSRTAISPFWPGLTKHAMNKHLKTTPATAMGHINQRCQNIGSNSKSDMEDETVTPSGLGSKTHLVCAVVIDQGKLYTDLTGSFPVRSIKGNWYVMICYSYDCNYVKPVPMNLRVASEWLKAYGEFTKN